MDVKKSLLVVSILTFVCAESKKCEFVEVTGYSVDDPDVDFTIIINVRKNLNEDIQCRSLKKITWVAGSLSTLRRDYVSDLPNLEEINLLPNIDKLEPGAFRNVPKLTSITIRSYYLKEIPEGVFNHLNVSSLSFSGHRLKQIASKAFNNMPKLEKIDLDSNQLIIWDSNWFMNTPNLKRVGFSGNMISVLPNEAFKNIRNRDAEVDLSYNQIHVVGNRLFGGVKQIKRLVLSQNRIENFNEAVLDGVEEMEELILYGNEINCFNGSLDRILFAKKIVLPQKLNWEDDCSEKITKWNAEQDPKHEISYS